jgi:hypothetical protein
MDVGVSQDVSPIAAPCLAGDVILMSGVWQHIAGVGPVTCRPRARHAAEVRWTAGDHAPAWSGRPDVSLGSSGSPWPRGSPHRHGGRRHGCLEVSRIQVALRLPDAASRGRVSWLRSAARRRHSISGVAHLLHSAKRKPSPACRPRIWPGEAVLRDELASEGAAARIINAETQEPLPGMSSDNAIQRPTVRRCINGWAAKG